MNQLDHIEDRVESIYTLLHGSSDDSAPDGLVQKVQMNTRFRQNWLRLFWVVITAIVGLSSSLIILILKTL